MRTGTGTWHFKNWRIDLATQPMLALLSHFVRTFIKFFTISAVPYEFLRNLF